MTWLALYHFNDTGTDTVVDVSGNGYDINLAAVDADQVTGGQTGGALGKTGSVMPVLPAGLLAVSESDDRTIMFDALGTGRAVWWIRWNDDVLGSGIWGVLALDGTTLQSRARRQSDSAAAGALTFGTTSAGTWRNVCLTYVRSTAVLSVYLDGTLVTSGVPSGWSAGQQLMVGADRIDLAEWTATGPSMDNLRIATHAADATEVAALAGTPVTAGDFELALGPAAETDTAVPLGRAKARSLGPAGATEQAQLVGAAKAQALGPAALVETARPLGRHKALALGTAYDIVTAQPFGRSKALLLPPAVETVSVVAVGARKTRFLGTANETDTALSFNQPVPVEGPPDVGRPQTVTSVGIGPPERVDLVHVGIT